MTGVLLAAGAGDDPISAAVREAPIELRLDDSLKSLAAPIRSMSGAMAGVLIASLAVHAVLLATAVIGGRPAVAPPPQEIAVDIVQNVPKPAAKPPEPSKPPPAKSQVAKLEPAKPEPPEPARPKPVPEPAKAQPQPQAAKPPSEAAKPPAQVAKPPPQPASPEQAAKPPADAKEIDALQKELSDLRAQQAALKSVPQDAPAAAAPAAGPLARSLQAIAMPAVGVDGETVGYQELVFSQLAKAKGDGEYHGQAGTTGVKFEVDAEGRLLGAEVAASSGSARLDKEALEIVHRAAPFPPPPKDADHTFFANVNFRPPKA